MKKLGYLLSVICLVLICVGCGASERYADKVNAAAEANEHYTYSQVIEDLGEPVTDLTTGQGVNLISGVAIWIKGCDSYEKAKAKYDEGQTVYSLTITFALNNAVSATWSEWQPE